MEEIEERIAVIEAKLGENEELLCDPAIFQDHEKVQNIQTENDTLHQELESFSQSGKSYPNLKGALTGALFSFSRDFLSTLVSTTTSLLFF
ncbi:ABC transporter C-terminal domain-containing protein [Bacillus sp. SL00103]